MYSGTVNMNAIKNINIDLDPDKLSSNINPGIPIVSAVV
jgi:hypothetical protein